jgi:hypothetical protein
MKNLAALAAENLARLQANPYPGRGLILGRSADGARLLQLYWIMGRSANSRNRVFVEEGGRLLTRPLDPALLKDPALVIYTAMDAHGLQHVVSNGDQTDTVVESLRQGGDYRDALRRRNHEPDAPHYTPRIAGGIAADTGAAWLALLKADPADPGHSLRSFYEIEALAPGYGWCLHTYRGDGEPLPSFVGEPVLLPLEEPEQDCLQAHWGRLNKENRIAIALKSIRPGSGQATLRIVNKSTAPA